MKMEARIAPRPATRTWAETVAMLGLAAAALIGLVLEVILG
jgi:hypothetical protein